MNAIFGTVPKLAEAAVTFAVQYSFQILGGLVILFAGYKLAAYAAGYAMRFGQQREIDITLTKFLAGCARFAIVGLAIIAALSNFGITIAPMIAAIGAAAFGATMAIQGPLSNYGAGLSIILSRPFVVGNTITVKGVSGVVEEIDLAATVLLGDGGERITVPNKEIVGEILVDSRANRIVQTAVRAFEPADVDAMIAAIGEGLANHPDIARDPSPQVGIQSIGTDSVTIGIRYWVPGKNYYPARFAANRALREIYQRLGLRKNSPSESG